MLPKKGDLTECSNYRSIAFIPHMAEIMLNIMQGRLRIAIDKHLREEQGGFRKDRSTMQQILALGLMAEDKLSKGGKLYRCFTDFRKAFDSVWHDSLWAALEAMAVPSELLGALQL